MRPLLDGWPDWAATGSVGASHEPLAARREGLRSAHADDRHGAASPSRPDARR